MSKKNEMDFKKLMNPTLEALHELGGSATIDEIIEKMIEHNDFPVKVIEEPLYESDPRSELEYKSAWARTYLKKFGFLENSSRGVWALTEEGLSTKTVDPDEVEAYVRSLDESEVQPDGGEKETEKESWRQKLHSLLMELSSEGFEKLCKRLLRESGFNEVEVTRRGADEGIDGTGIVKLSGLLSFHVVFQAKRWKGNVGSGVIRDFRGSMQGRADKGIVITTSRFTKSAVEEATRDGATPIDLIDGEELLNRLKELQIGLKVKIIQKEAVQVKSDFFEKLDSK